MIMNNRSDATSGFHEGVQAGLETGAVSIPMLLLTTYAKLDLTEAEAMLILHLISFSERDKKEFPTPEELTDRMSLPEDQVTNMLQKLMKEGFIDIDELTDSISGILYERYNLEGLWRQLAIVWSMEWKKKPADTVKTPDKPDQAATKETSIYGLFEKEFARPLTPMEMETINNWLDRDQYPLDLIRMALKEAVFAGKLHFRYIDRTLLDWKRNKIFTPEQAREHAQRFRGNN